MATTLAGSIEIVPSIRVRYTNSDSTFVDSYGTPSSLLAKMKVTFSDGTSNLMAQKHYHKEHTITASGSTTLDLTALADERGNTFNFSKVRWLIIRIQTPGTGVALTLGNASSNIFAPWLSSTTTTEEIQDMYFRDAPYAGWTVSGSAKNVKIANGTGSNIICDVSIGGI